MLTFSYTLEGAIDYLLYYRRLALADERLLVPQTVHLAADSVRIDDK